MVKYTEKRYLKKLGNSKQMKVSLYKHLEFQAVKNNDHY